MFEQLKTGRQLKEIVARAEEKIKKIVRNLA